MAKPSTDKIHVGVLQLSPKKEHGMLVLISEEVSEKLYNLIKGNLFEKNKKGKVELGYTENNGVRLRIASSRYLPASHLVDTLLSLGQSIVKDGVQRDLKQMDGARPDLSFSFNNIDFVMGEEYSKDYKILSELKGINYRILNPFKLTDYQIKIVESTPLVPSGYKAEYL